MSTELIDSVIDTPKIKAEFDFLRKNLLEMRTVIMEYPTIKMQIEGAASVRELVKAQTDLSESNKKLQAMAEQRAASEAKIVTVQKTQVNSMREYEKAVFEGKLATQAYNKELKDEVALQTAATGSIAKMKLEIKELTKLRNAENVATAEGAKRAAELNKQIDSLNDVITANSDGLTRRKTNIGNYEGSAKIIVDALEKEKQKLEELEKVKIRVQNAGSSFQPGVAAQRTTVTGFGGGGATGGLSNISSQANMAEKSVEELNEEIAKSRTIIEGFSRVTEQPQFLNVAGKVGDATAELKFFTKALIDMERNGLGNSEAANILRKNLAELTDEIGDTRAEVKALSSDTRSFDLFAGSVTFAADAFQTFAGAAVLAGASEEDAAEATKTLVAVQSVANGVKGIANELTTRGTAANKAYAFAQRNVALAMDGTATAGARLKGVLVTLGIGAVIIGLGLLIANYGKIKDALLGLSEAQKLNNEVSKRAAENTAEQVSQLSILVDRVKQGELSFREKQKAVEDYNTTFGETLGAVKDYAELEKKLIESGADYIEYLQLKGNAEAAYQLALEQSKKAINASVDTDRIGFAARTMLALKYGNIFDEKGEYAQAVNAANKRLTNNEINEAESKSKKLLAIQQENLTKMNALADRLKLPVDGADKDKAKKDKKVKAAKEEVDAEFEIYKINQQRKIELLQEDVENEAAAFQQRMIMLTDFYRARLALIDREEAKEKEGKSKNEILVIEAKFNDQRIRLAKEVNDRLIKLREEAGPRAIAQAQILADKQLAIIKNFLKKQEELNKAAADKELSRLEDANKRKADLYKELYQEIQSTVFAFLNDNLTREDQDLDEKKRLLDEETRRRINNVEQLGLAEVDRVKTVARIEKEAQFQSEQIEKRKRAIAVERAKFEKAASVASIIAGTAQAVIAALKVGPPQGFVLAGLTAAIGALQLAKAISVPLPKYKDGTDSAKRGKAIFGEEGRELVIPTHGKPYLSPGVATLTNLIGGEKIIPADVTANILNAAGMQKLAGMDLTRPITADGVNSHLMGGMLRELKDINRKSRINIYNSPGIKTGAWYDRHFKN